MSVPPNSCLVPFPIHCYLGAPPLTLSDLVWRSSPWLPALRYCTVVGWLFCPHLGRQLLDYVRLSHSVDNAVTWWDLTAHIFHFLKTVRDNLQGRTNALRWIKLRRKSAAKVRSGGDSSQTLTAEWCCLGHDLCQMRFLPAFPPQVSLPLVGLSEAPVTQGPCNLFPSDVVQLHFLLLRFCICGLDLNFWFTSSQNSTLFCWVNGPKFVPCTLSYQKSLNWTFWNLMFSKSKLSRKNIRQTYIEGCSSTQYFSKTVKVINPKESLRTCHGPEEAKEM